MVGGMSLESEVGRINSELGTAAKRSAAAYQAIASAVRVAADPGATTEQREQLASSVLAESGQIWLQSVRMGALLAQTPAIVIAQLALLTNAADPETPPGNPQ